MDRSKFRKCRSVVLGILIGSFVAAGVSPALTSDEALILLDWPDETAMLQTIQLIESQGGKVLLIYPPHVLIGQVPPAVKDQVLADIDAVVSVHYGLVDTSIVESYGKLALWGVEYWNNRLSAVAKPVLPEEKRKLLPPPDDVIMERPRGLPLRKPVEEWVYPEGPEQTSAYMVGSTVVSVILLESNGAIDPSTEDWTEKQIAQVRTEVGEALEWWAKNAPDDAHVWFVVDTVMVRETSYEPITRALYRDFDQTIMIFNEVMRGLGYSDENYYVNLIDYANNLRGGSYDWSFVVFVTDSFNDVDGTLSDGYHAFASYQGPYVMLTYDNGLYGIKNMDAVLAHEIAHVFGAWDEYGASYSIGTYGFLQVENKNVSNAVNRMGCLMATMPDAYLNNQICYFTRGQIGWRDKDNDNILDSIDSSFNPGMDSDGDGIVDYWDGLFVVGPRKAKILVGESRLFSTIGGSPPYTWSSSNPAVGSIEAYTGKFKGKGVGTTIVTMTDGEGRSVRDPVVITVVGEANAPPDTPPLVVTPIDGSSGQDTILTLVWAAEDQEGEKLLYDVYLGKTAQIDSTNLVLQDYFWTEYSVEGLEPGTTYYWQVVAFDGQGRIPSPVWQFRTKFRYNLRLAGYSIDDATGDNDGRLDTGETVGLTVRLKNLGQEVSGLSVFLRSSDPSAVVLSDSSSTGYIPFGETRDTIRPFIVAVSSSVPDHVRFTLEITTVEGLIGTETFVVPIEGEQVFLETKGLGPYGGGRILTLAIDPHNSEVLYAGVWNAGIFKTIDGGESWFPINNGLSGFSTVALVINSSNPDVLFAGTKKGIYKSINGGQSWKALSSSPPGVVNNLTIDPSNNTTIYADVEHILFKSTDSGESWQPVGNGLSYRSHTNIMFSPANPETMYLADDYGIYRSINGGFDWMIITEGVFYSIAVSPHNPDVIYAGGGKITEKLENGIMRSLDGGETWKYIAHDVGISSFAFDPVDTKVIYAGADNGVYKSTDGGTSWFPVHKGLPKPMGGYTFGWNSVVVDPEDPSTLYFASPTDGVFKSADGGLNWRPKNRGLGGTIVHDIAIDPRDAKIIYAATETGVWRSENRGETWEQRNKGIEEANVKTIAVDLNGVVYVGCWGTPLQLAGLFRSEDGGIHWSKVQAVWDPDYPDSPFPVAAIAIGGGDMKTVYIYIPGVRPGGMVFRSTDGGFDWQDFSRGLVLGEEFDFVKLSVNPYQPEVVFLVGRKRLYRSTGYYPNWKLVGEGFNPIDQFTDLQVAPDGTVYLTTVGHGEPGVYKSTDGGGTWVRLVDGLGFDPNITAIAVDNGNPNIIFAGRAGGKKALFRSIDRGLHWDRIFEQESSAWITSLIITPDGKGVYMGTNGGGVYRIDIGVSSSSTAVAGEYLSDGTPVRFTLGPNYPNPFNPATEILYQLPQRSYVKIRVYNLLGQKVRTFAEGIQEPGHYTVRWDGLDSQGQSAASGVYFYRLTVDGGRWTETKKMLLLR